MENTILDLFENQKLTPGKISKKLKISIEKIRNVLEKHHYLTIGRTWQKSVDMKHAIDYYLNNPTVLIDEAAKKFQVYPDNLSLNLRKLGYSIEDRKNIPQFDDHIFDVIDTEEKAYWLGFIFADGYIQAKNTVHFRHCFAIGLATIDTHHLEKFNSFIKCKINKVRIDKYHQCGKEKERCIWSCGNKNIWTALNNLGCVPNKSLILKFPTIEKNLIRHFIRGYFDGDGTLGAYGKHKYPSCSLVGTKDMLDHIIQQLPFNPTIYHHKGHKEETLTMSFACQKAIDFLNYIYNDSKIYLDRKYNKYYNMCRLWEKSHGLSETKIGENCDVDPEVTKEIKESLAP